MVRIWSYQSFSVCSQGRLPDMEVYRLSKRAFAGSLSGSGAALSGGRWNRKGTEVIYTASSRALAMTEVLVHLPLNLIPNDYMICTILIPDSLTIYQPKETSFPKGWNTFPIQTDTQIFGDKLLEKRMSPVIRVPSAVVIGDYNFLLDPKHPDFDKIILNKVEPFKFDRRFFTCE